MKRTTYIIIGLLVAGLVVMCGGMLYVYRSVYASPEDSLMRVGGEMKTVDLPQCKVVEMVDNRVIVKRQGGRNDAVLNMFKNAPLKLTQAETEQGTFTYASGMDEFMTMEMRGDTLRVVFSFPQDKIDKKHRDLYVIYLESDDMVMSLPSGVELFKADLAHQHVDIDGFNRDSLSVEVRHIGTVNNCNFGALTVSGNMWEFSSGRVDNLHLRLDGINQWDVKSSGFFVDTAHLYSSRHQRCFSDKEWCRRVVWNPQAEKASLEMKIKRGATVILND